MRSARFVDAQGSRNFHRISLPGSGSTRRSYDYTHAMILNHFVFFFLFFAATFFTFVARVALVFVFGVLLLRALVTRACDPTPW